MTVACPSCQHVFAATAELHELDCPSCQNRFANPLQAVQPQLNPSVVPRVEAHVAAGPAPSRSKTHDEEEIEGGDRPASILEESAFMRDSRTVSRWLMTAFWCNTALGTVFYLIVYFTSIMFGAMGMLLFSVAFQYIFPLIVVFLFLGSTYLNRRENFGFVQTAVVMCGVLALGWVGFGVFCAIQASPVALLLAAMAFGVAALSLAAAWFAYPLVTNVDFQTRFSDSARLKVPERRTRRHHRDEDDDYDD